MKKYILLLIMGSMVVAVTAQTRIPATPVFRSELLYVLPAPENSAYVFPDWYYELPIPENTTYVYTKAQGEGATQREALNRAYAQTLEATALRLGITVNTADIHEAVQSGKDFNVISRAMKIPVNKVCDFYVQDSKTRRWTAHILCQVAEKGYTDVEWEPCQVCAGHTKYDKQMAYWKKCIEDDKKAKIAAQKREDGIALIESFFIPGLGQMMKGSAHGKQSWMVEGASTLVSEVALFSIGAGCYLGAKKQQRLSNEWGIDYDTYTNAVKQKKTLMGTSYAFFGLAVALHGFNMYRAYTMREQKKYAFYPVIIPTDDKNLAYGLGATIKF